MIQQLNKALEKFMPLLTPTAVLTGILLHESLGRYSYLVPWIFAWMTFAGSLSSNFQDLQRVIKHPQPILANFSVLHLIMPVLAWICGQWLFPGDVLTQTGLILMFAIPTGVVSMVWVSIYRGAVALTLSLILLDTLLSPFIVPLTLSLSVGAKVNMDSWALMKGLLWMVVIPSLIGMTLNQATRGKVKEKWSANLAPFSKIGLFIVVAINGSVLAPYLEHPDWKLLKIIVVAFVLAVIGYIAGLLISRALKWERDVTVALMFNSGMRNLSAGAVLAIAYFPPPVATPVIAGMLFQQIMASLFGHAFARLERSGSRRNNHAGAFSQHPSGRNVSG